MKKLNIVFVSSEVAPYSKTGGLADVSGTLPGVLAELGNNVLVFTPLYRSVDRKKFKLREVKLERPLRVTVTESEYDLKLLTPAAGADAGLVHLIDCPKMFDRQGLYVDPTTGKDYPDNDLRFIFFAQAVLAALPQLGFKPDIIHANDWQAALLPAYLKTVEAGRDFFLNTRSLLTVHNMGYHGLFPMERAANLGLPKSYFTSMSPFEFWGKVNFLKAGIQYADIVNTVSETYAREIQTTDDFGCGLEGVLRDRAETVFGIVNGVNYDEWSPEKDKLIAHKFSIDNLEGKQVNKRKLIKLSGLDRALENKPLIGVISRLADQKGFDLIEEVADELFALDFTLVLLGTGDKKYHDLFAELEKEHPNRIKAHLTFDNKLAHQIEAGADMFLMPSHYEPCGLNQLYSLKYGTVPIARRTGGLADTIVDYETDRRNSTGFLFDEYDGQALLTAVKRALEVYRNQRSWTALMKRGMRQDFSWEKSAKAYLKLYRQALSS